MLQRIRSDAESVVPPASLEPEQVERLLCQANGASDGESSSDRANGRKKWSRRIFRYGSIAAVLAVGFTAAWQYQNITGEITDRALSSGSTSMADGQLEAALEKETEEEAPAMGGAGADAAVSVTEGSSEAADGAAADSAEADAAVLGSEEGAEAADGAAADSAEADGQFVYASSYEEIYTALRDRFYVDYSLYDTDGTDISGVEVEEAAVDTADTAVLYSSVSGSARNSVTYDSGYGAEAADEVDYSQTNVQEQGVDEADIIKTDGAYIYILRSDLSLAIVRADGASSETVSVTSLPVSGEAWIQEMYLDGDTLSVLITEYVSTLESGDDYVYYSSSRNQVRLITYDVTDRSAPVETGSVTQEGSYSDSRKSGSYIYLFTRYYPSIQGTYEDSDILPSINGQAAEASSFYLPENINSRAYLVISSVDTSEPSEICDSKILVSGGYDFYVSSENIYITNEIYDSTTRTEIVKFHYEDGTISAVAAGSVPGYLNDSFSLNEYDGMLRVVSTYYGTESDDWTEHNALYVLDESLQRVGEIEDLAEGETIRSARFFGDTGYFVTYRQTDPLFSVDLSDPENPQILGELKVSGFSSYLHFYSENLLLGIGYEADEDTGETTGLKLSMFDISDPSNVTEVDRYVLPGITWCPAIEDYKAILVSPEKNLIGFYCDERYLVFSYEEGKGFTRELLYDFYTDMIIEGVDYDTMRGLYIGDTFYLAGNTFLISFDLENGFQQLGVLNID